MRIMLISAMVMLSSICSLAASTDVKAKHQVFTEYGFSVDVPEDAALIHSPGESGKDSNGNTTKSDIFVSKDALYTVDVTTYSTSIEGATADYLELMARNMSNNSLQIHKVYHDTKDGQPCITTRFTTHTQSGTELSIQVMITFKGNHLYVISYIREQDEDSNGYTFMSRLKLL